MSRNDAFELTLARFIRAPLEKVFDAFVTEQGIRGWMCPRGMTIPELSMDPRVGGGFRLTMRARDGEQFTAVAHFREIARPERLVYTWHWVGEGMPNVETLITVAFAPRADGTEVRMTHSGFPDAALCESHREGWGSCFNRLADLLDPEGTAASVTLLGDPRSTYTRSARMGLAEKGIRYRLQRCGPHTPEIGELHPWGRIPAFRDGDVQLFETTAILRYVEEAFPGPTLLPQNIRDRALAEQWASAVNAYFYDLAVRRYVLQHLFNKDDASVRDAAAKELPAALGRFEAGYSRPFLAGQSPTLPDFLLAPIVGYLEAFPESKAMLSNCPKLMRAHEAMKARASWKETQP